jgi:outer membrane protein TolC
MLMKVPLNHQQLSQISSLQVRRSTLPVRFLATAALTSAVLSGGCAVSEQSRRESAAATSSPVVAPREPAPIALVDHERPLPSQSQTLRPVLVSAQVEESDPVPPRELDLKPPEELLAADAARPITLLAVLEAVDRENPNVNLARMRVEEAYAQWDRADALWLPSLRAGLNYNKHEGRIQDVLGNNVETSRGAFYSGLGANAVGAGSPAVPGVYANFHLSDAVFQPRIASEVTAAREANAEAVTNDYLLQAAQAYLELLRATQELAIAREIRELAARLEGVTESYAKTGQGLAADHDRAATELALRTNDVVRGEEAVQVASARLAQLLSLDPTMPLAPQEPAVVPLELMPGDEAVQGLVAMGLGNRPEVRESDALVGEAVRRLARERYAPLLPSVLLGVSYGGFGAGRGGDIDAYSDRLDADAALWWEIRNLGLGERAVRSQMQSQIDQAQLRQVAILDQIAREVVESHTQVQNRKRQLEVAQDAVKVARSSYDRNLERIANAQGLPLEVLQSIQAQAQAQREYLRVVTDYNLAQFALQRALGWPSGPYVGTFEAAP